MNSKSNGPSGRLSARHYIELSVEASSDWQFNVYLLVAPRLARKVPLIRGDTTSVSGVCVTHNDTDLSATGEPQHPGQPRACASVRLAGDRFRTPVALEGPQAPWPAPDQSRPPAPRDSRCRPATRAPRAAPPHRAPRRRCRDPAPPPATARRHSPPGSASRTSRPGPPCGQAPRRYARQHCARGSDAATGWQGTDRTPRQAAAPENRDSPIRGPD